MITLDCSHQKDIHLSSPHYIQGMSSLLEEVIALRCYYGVILVFFTESENLSESSQLFQGLKHEHNNCAFEGGS